MKCPDELEFTSADVVAECFSFNDDKLKSKLWKFVAEAENPTPFGGDGSNETAEEPVYDSNCDDNAPHWWHKLTEEEQRTITNAMNTH